MLHHEIIYQIFVRNYSKEGTFKAVENDLERIKDLGVDIVYLMPIHEIGELNRKGTFGSPYAIKDYYSLNKGYGTKEDFVSLVNKTHKLGMKMIIDMVFNHTAPDNVIVEEHPEYYYYKNGKRGNRIGDWSDVVDLDTYRDDTQNYLVGVLKYWVSLGVDGFRFDVSSMIPLSFFQRARKELGKDIIFIGESIEESFYDYLVSIGDHPTHDDEVFPTFDSLYNYSWYNQFKDYLLGKEDLSVLVKMLNKDETLLFGKGIRMNTVENHDLDRIAHLAKGKNLKEIISFLSYIKGQMFIYAGQEYGISHRPDLFEKDPIDWKKDENMKDVYLKAIQKKKEQHNEERIFQRFSKINNNTIEVAKYIDDHLIDKLQFEL